jgi:hypothetical protein
MRGTEGVLSDEVIFRGAAVALNELADTPKTDSGRPALLAAAEDWVTEALNRVRKLL